MHCPGLERQRDATDCGPACLLTALRMAGGEASFVEIRELCNTGPRGTSLAALSRAARAIGFDCDGAQGSYSELAGERMPCIAHVVTPEGRDHFVVVKKIGPKKVEVADPGRGCVTLPRSEFEARWSGTVLLLAPTPRLRRTEVPDWKSWIWSYVSYYETALLQSVFLGVVYTGLGLVTALFVQLFIDRLIPMGAVRLIVVSGGVLVLLQLFRSLLGILRARFLLALNYGVAVGVTDDLVRRLLQVPARFFDGRRKGDLNARLDDAVVVQGSVVALAGSAVTDILIVAGSTGFVFFFSPLIGWISLAGLVLYGALLAFAAVTLGEEESEVRGGYGLLQSEYYDALGGIEAIRAYGFGSGFAGRLSVVNELFQSRMRRLGFTQAKVTAAVEFCGGALIAGILVVGATQVSRGVIGLGEFMASYALAATAIPSLNRLSQLYMSLKRWVASAGRLADLRLSAVEDQDGAPLQVPIVSLRLDNATLVRRGREAPVLKNVSLTVTSGTLVGILGYSGSGKTTLAALLARAHPPTSGGLFVNDRNAEEVSLPDFRRRVVVVPESDHMFHGTIADNIAMGRNYTPVEVQDRVEALGLQRLLERLGNDLSDRIGDGGRVLSSGEEQMVAFLRGVLEEPDVLIVDEGTNALDEDTAAMLDHFLKEYSHRRCVIVISHHRDRLRRCDIVYEVSDGGVHAVEVPQETRSGV